MSRSRWIADQGGLENSPEKGAVLPSLRYVNNAAPRVKHIWQDLAVDDWAVKGIVPGGLRIHEPCLVVGCYVWTV